MKQFTLSIALMLLAITMPGSGWITSTPLQAKENLPKYDIMVAPDGSGQFTKVQQAIDSIPADNKKRIVIYIKKGLYQEKISINKSFITLIGEDAAATKLTYLDYAKMKNTAGSEIGTFATASVSIYGNDFIAANLTFENSAGPGAEVGQALAVDASGDRLIFYNCIFLGYQDTLFTGKTGRQYYEKCYIRGDVDFIFGSATAVFAQCEIFSQTRNKFPNGYITAASTTQEQKYGYVFLNSKLTSDATPDSVYLGRPWKDYAAVSYINCEMGPHILPQGWLRWNNIIERDKTVRYYEYGSTGPGAKPDQRVNWSRQLTAAEAGEFTVKNILSGNDKWDPAKVLEKAVK
jgi:pectinesterase